MPADSATDGFYGLLASERLYRTELNNALWEKKEDTDLLKLFVVILTVLVHEGVTDIALDGGDGDHERGHEDQQRKHPHFWKTGGDKHGGEEGVMN